MEYCYSPYSYKSFTTCTCHTYEVAFIYYRDFLKSSPRSRGLFRRASALSANGRVLKFFKQRFIVLPSNILDFIQIREHSLIRSSASSSISPGWWCCSWSPGCGGSASGSPACKWRPASSRSCRAWRMYGRAWIELDLCIRRFLNKYFLKAFIWRCQTSLYKIPGQVGAQYLSSLYWFGENQKYPANNLPEYSKAFFSENFYSTLFSDDFFV